MKMQCLVRCTVFDVEILKFNLIVLYYVLMTLAIF